MIRVYEKNSNNFKYLSYARTKNIQCSNFPNSLWRSSIIDKTNILPFDMKRIFYIYNNPKGGRRGDHAHKILIIHLVSKGSIQVLIFL